MRNLADSNIELFELVRVAMNGDAKTVKLWMKPWTDIKDLDRPPGNGVSKFLKAIGGKGF